MDDAPAAHRRRPWTTRRYAAALPTAAIFDHMATAFDDQRFQKAHGMTTTRRVTFLREATRRPSLLLPTNFVLAFVPLALVVHFVTSAG